MEIKCTMALSLLSQVLHIDISHINFNKHLIYGLIEFSFSSEWRADKSRLYNFSKVKKSRKWLKVYGLFTYSEVLIKCMAVKLICECLFQNILLSDSSSDEDDEPLTNDDLKEMLRLHKYQRKCRSQFYRDREVYRHSFWQKLVKCCLYNKYQIYPKSE